MKSLSTRALISLTMVSLARAADPVHEFECDTPAGHVSHWSQTLQSGKLAVAGTLDIKERREHERWNPVASVMLVAKPTGSLGLQIYTLKAQKDVLLVRITEPETRQEAPYATIAVETTSIPFSISFAKDGTLNVTAGGKSASTTIKGFRPDRIQLSCSTGNFMFKDVTINQKR
jgi:hypothetical protein